MSEQRAKKYIVTGATGTLGCCVSQQLVARGDHVLLVARDQQKLDELQQRLAAREQVSVFQGDLTIPEVAQQAVQTAVEQFGTVQGLIHLVGLFMPGPASTTPAHLYKQLFESNVISALNVTQPLLAHLDDGACLIYMSSSLAHDPVQGLGAYAASKAALVAWARSLARELYPRARVNVVSTTTLASPLTRERFRGKAALRLVDPEQVANVVLALTTSGFVAMNGAVLPVYGDFTLEDPAATH